MHPEGNMIVCSIYASIRLVLCYTYITCTLYCLRPPRLCTHLPTLGTCLRFLLVCFLSFPSSSFTSSPLATSVLSQDAWHSTRCLVFRRRHEDDGMGTNMGRAYVPVCVFAYMRRWAGIRWMEGAGFVLLVLGFLFSLPLNFCLALVFCICMRHCINMAWAFCFLASFA